MQGVLKGVVENLKAGKKCICEPKHNARSSILNNYFNDYITF